MKAGQVMISARLAGVGSFSFTGDERIGVPLYRDWLNIVATEDLEDDEEDDVIDAEFDAA